MALAPWSRPPLPTYANAVGFRGTGDVEDAQIAGAPPPEYGNTRGSTLLLSTFFGGAPLGRSASRSSNNSATAAGRDAQIMTAEDPRGRPVSYTSQIGVPAPAAAAGSSLAVPERAASRLSSLTVEEDARRSMLMLAFLEYGEQLSPSPSPSATRPPPPVTLRPARR